jgi:hypothetical protein
VCEVQVVTKQVYHLQAGLAVNLKSVNTRLAGSLLFRDELLDVLPLFLAEALKRLHLRLRQERSYLLV